jgi:transcriptional regulator
MYLPTHFQESRLPVLHEFMRQHPLAWLIAQANGRVDANPIPLLLDPAQGPYGRLRGHIARANPMWKDVAAGEEVLLLFQGGNGYVSPAYYPSKKEHGKVVPTWNYSVVEARGRIAWMHDAQWLLRFVEELTATHEAGRPDPWKVSDAPADYIQQMIRGIVGFEIEVDEITGKMKLSQNRSEADRSGVIRAFQEQGDAGTAALAGQMRGQ